MAVSLKHAKVSAKLDGVDTTAVLPSDWNAEHALTATAGKVLGTPIGSSTVTELPIEVDATSQSMKPPSGTTAQRPSSPSAGMLRYNTTLGFLEAYYSSAWQALNPVPTGTKMLFQQTSAPTGWTKDTTHNDKALRVVSGAASSGGSVAFSGVFAARTTSATAAGGTVGDTALNINQIPSHSHYAFWAGDANSGDVNAGTYPYSQSDQGNNYSYKIEGSANVPNAGAVSYNGGSGTHTHSFTGASHSHTLEMSVQYVDLIIATKN